MVRWSREIWTRYDDKSVAQEDSSDEVFIRIGIDPDHQIKPFLDHVDRTVFGRDLEPDFRILQREGGGDLAHCGLREKEGRADPQLAARPFAA